MLQEWIQQNNVLDTVLRDSLHQPQYVEKLEKIIRFMIKEKALTSEDLDKIWGAQVSHNSSFLLCIACKCQSAQLLISFMSSAKCCKCDKTMWHCKKTPIGFHFSVNFQGSKTRKSLKMLLFNVLVLLI